ncbi:hypothetical protein J4Q44_G00056660 [Coregonus suidteri]|uniref:AIG1-type G domain-containing protein n=1 Tax=Coregonus suidteri TaxID=861788 RepID=A0AAN8MAH8_9TELE
MESQGEGYPPFSVSTGGDESMQGVMQKEWNPSLSAPPLPELRLVLLGRKGTGKSSAANTILGGIGGFEIGRPTEECSKRRADLTGRRVTVVDTPGWEWYYPLNSTPDWVRRETLRSMSLCSPGPHVVLLVIRSCASVTESYRKQIEEHLESLGEGVLDHTMLLFTRGDELGVVPMEHRILTGGAAFQQLLRRCGNRYHVLDNRSRGDGTQVRELLRKMEEMVDNKGGHFGADPALLSLEADGRRRARERRKRQRQMEAQTQRGTIRAVLLSDTGSQGSEWDGKQPFSKGTRRLPELRLVLLGERETGKSSAGNTILGGEGAGFFQTGRVTEECARCQAEVAMRLVTVVDTPGWEGGVAGPTPERVKREMVWGSVSLCPPGPHAVLLTLRVDTLVGATPVREHLELLGEEVWRHTVLLFTHGDQLREGVGIEQHIQSGGRDLKWLVEKCGSRYHVISNVNGCGDATQVLGLLEKVEKMVAGNRCEAFSSLVQEVSDLTRQRNEKFNQRLKEVGDKMQRQETELKRMREREVKRIRWFFNRKKKVKSPGKSGVEKEEDGGEEEEKRSDGRKNEMGELEEWIRWLTEDKEREIQDLGMENDRVIAMLNQRSREREETVNKLEEKEREIEELKERVDEQQQLVTEKEKEIVEARARSVDNVKEIERLKENNENKKSEMVAMQQQHTEYESRRDAETMDKLQGKEVELNNLKQKDRENERELVSLRQTIKQTKTELENLTATMEKEMMNMIQEYEKEIKTKDVEMRLMLEDKESSVSQLQKMDEESRKDISGMTEYLRDSQRKVEELQDLNVKLKKEMDNLRKKCQEYEEDQGFQRTRSESREADIRELLCGYEEQLKKKDGEIHHVMKEWELEVVALKQTNDERQKELEKMKEEGEVREKQVDEMRWCYEKNLRERQNELKQTAEEKEKELEKRERAFDEKEREQAKTGYTILGSEASHPGGSISMPWRGQIAGRQVSVVEPLGLKWRNGPDDNTTITTDPTQLQNIFHSVSLSHPGPHAILLVLPAYLSFTQKYRRAVEHHMSVLGEDIWHRTMVLFTWGEALGESAEQHILRNGDLQWLVGQCGGRFHILASRKNNSQTAELMEKIEEMVAENGDYQCNGD